MSFNLTVVRPGGGTYQLEMPTQASVNGILQHLFETSGGKRYKFIGYEGKELRNTSEPISNVVGEVGGYDMLRAVPIDWVPPVSSGSGSRVRSPPRGSMPAPAPVASPALVPSRSLQSQFAVLRSRLEQLRRQEDAILQQMEDLVTGQ